MNLFIITQLSDLVWIELLKYSEKTVITPHNEIAQDLHEVGINVHFLPPINNLSQKEMHKQFYVDFMPGVLKDERLDDFPIWEALSMDRLRFWQMPNEAIDLISSLNFDHLYVSIDMMHTLPWAIGYYAQQKSIPVTGIKTHSLRTREFYDFYPYAPLDSIIVSFDDEKELCQKVDPEKSVIVKTGKRKKRKQIESQQVKELQKSLNVPPDTLGIVFDKRDEWQCRKFLSTLSPTRTALIFPYDSRSAELVRKCIPHQLLQRVQVMDNYHFIGACSELIMFRFLEDVYNHIPNIPVAIFDYHNLNLSAELAIIEGR